MITHPSNDEIKDFNYSKNGSFSLDTIKNDVLNLSYYYINDDEFSEIIFSIVRQNINGIRKINSCSHVHHVSSVFG